jgi:cytoskeletal protein RodZ
MAETIGRQLKYARLAQNLSIEEVVEATRIRPQYVEALEADNFEAFPSPAQGRGFLHNYAGFLGLKVEDILTRQRETPAPAADPSISSPVPAALVQAGQSLAPAPAEEPAPAAPEPVPAPFSWTEPLPSTEIVRPPESLVSTLEPVTASASSLWDKIAIPESTLVKTKSEAKSVKPVKKESKSIAKPSTKKAAPAKTAVTKNAAKKTVAKISPKGKKAPAVKPAAKKSVKRVAKSTAKPIKKSSAPAKKTTRKTITKKKSAAESLIEYETPPLPIPAFAFEPLPEITTIPASEPVEPIRLPEEPITESEPLPEIETIPEPEPEAPAAAAESPASSQEIFLSIGKELSERRELLGMTLEEIERHIHVRKHYLALIESGEFDKLPSSVQARGMINNYARFLDMDADALLLHFADGLQAQLQERHPAGEGMPEKRNRRAKVPSAIRRYFSVDMFIGGGLILLLILFAVWGTNQIITMRSTPTMQATAPSRSTAHLAHGRHRSPHGHTG